MKNFSLNKRHFIFTACSAMIVLPTISVSAQSIVINNKAANDSDLPQLNLVENDKNILFSSPESQAEKTSLEKIIIQDFSVVKEDVPAIAINNISDSGNKPSDIKLKEKKQQKQNSSAPLSVNNQVSIITPQAGITNKATTNISIQHHPSADINIEINGKPIDKSLSSYVHKDESQELNTTIWYKVPLSKGENTITAKAQGGNAVSVTVIFQEQKTKISINAVGESRIPADGRSSIDFRGNITDENGELIKKDAIVTLDSSAGKFIGADYKPDAPGFQVLARNGEFSASLQAGNQAQGVKVRAVLESSARRTSTRQLSANIYGKKFDSEAVSYVEFVTNLRPSLATGVVNLRIGAGGTDYYGSFRDFLNPEEIDKDTVVDLDAAVFATGKVGEWLFTGAYNSDRPLNQDCNGDNRLFGGVQSCEKQYPVYGDDSTVTNTAPSIDSVYARIERTPDITGAEADYFMWGDYNTQEFARQSQLYSATTRQLHGFKGNFNLGNLQVTGLFANNIEGFQRDTITPDGTSGYYFVSRRFVIPGSESIFIETEEINRPGTVVRRKALYRGADYEIDYDRGTILFRRPIFATELNPLQATLVNRIVVTYQNEAGEDSQLYGGRLQYNLRNGKANLDKTAFLGGSYLKEEQGSQDFELYGIDFYAPLASGFILGEYARSQHNTLNFGDVSGSAYRIEANANIGSGFKSKAYYRSVTENFANNATWSFAPGQTRYGADIAAKIGNLTSFVLGYDHEENFGIAPAERTQLFDLFNPQPLPTPGSQVDNSLTTVRAGIQQQIGESDVKFEYVNRSREDRVNNVFEGTASQLVSSLNVPLTESVNFRARNELNLEDSDPLYPNRTTLGLDWRLYPGVTMRLAHQFFDGGLLRGNNITSLDTLVEHKFTQDTSISGRYSILSGIDGMNDQGSIGLNQRIRVAPGLRIDLGYERVLNDIFGSTAAGVRFAQPYAVGQSASSLGLFEGSTYSVGMSYTDNPNFNANARFEYRDGNQGNNTVITAAAAGKISSALTAAVRYKQAGGANQLLDGLADTANLRVGLAYRDPKSDKFNALLKYEYRQNPSTTPDTLLFGSGNGSIDHLFSAEAIYAPNWRWEFYGKYAFRNSNSYLANNFTSNSSLNLAQLRANYQLGYRTDLAIEGRWIGQLTQDYSEFGVAVEAGYYLTPDFRVGVGYAFGSADDRDFTGYRSAGGPYLNVSFKVNELFGGFGRQKVAPPQQQESLKGQR
ncbi:MAG: hypothetical protein KI793_17965 [Rivularia sp. (in: Bacteria)]|nr:hypothetical protein [Rivularia sp. MS3]